MYGELSAANERPVDEVKPPDTTNDEAIAQALAESPFVKTTGVGGHNSAGSGPVTFSCGDKERPPSTHLDEALAHQLNGIELSDVPVNDPEGSPTRDGSSPTAAPELDTGHSMDLDRALTSRISSMPSILARPRVNPPILPDNPSISRDRQRLLTRLNMYGLTELVVKGDGACQFRSLSDQLFRSPHHHKVVRREVVGHIRANPKAYEGFVPGCLEEYLKKMAKQSEWGDHVTLKAAADCYGTVINVVSSFEKEMLIRIKPFAKRSDRELFLSFWAEVHYNSLYPEGEKPPDPDPHAGKVLGSRRIAALLPGHHRRPSAEAIY